MNTLAVSLDGTTDLPPGKIATVVTFLERNAPAPSSAGEAVVVQVLRPEVGWYRALYRRIGENWLWFSRAAMDDGALQALLRAQTTEILTIRDGGADVGLAELDFSEAGSLEIVTFGVVPEAAGTGAAARLMQGALAAAAAGGATRVWLHTCTADHPAAMRFYRKAGFRPWKVAIEVADDPRLTGTLAADAAPHVPLIAGR